MDNQLIKMFKSKDDEVFEVAELIYNDIKLPSETLTRNYLKEKMRRRVFNSAGLWVTDFIGHKVTYDNKQNLVLYSKK